MGTVRVDVDPDILRWAARRAGWESADIEAREPNLAAWIAGERKPTLRQLEKFAASTHTPYGFFFLSEPPEETLPIPDMRTRGDARPPHLSANLQDTIKQCLLRQDWFHDYAMAEGLDPVAFVGSASISDSPVAIAVQIREVLGFSVDQRQGFASWEVALRSLIDRIEDTGVLVMINGVVGTNTHRRLDPDEFRGFALSDPLAPIVFVNGADTKAAQIFTLIHELAHIYLGESALSDANMAGRSKIAHERWCNQVAADVLVPLDVLAQEYRGEPSVEELERLARKFKVSTLVVLRRIYDSNPSIGWRCFRELYVAEQQRVLSILANRRDEQAGGNFYHSHVLRTSRLFAQALVTSTLEGTTTYRDAFRLIGTKKRDTFNRLAEVVGVP